MVDHLDRPLAVPELTVEHELATLRLQLHEERVRADELNAEFLQVHPTSTPTRPPSRLLPHH